MPVPALRRPWELNFAAYVLKVARNACYDAIEARKKVEPVAEDEDLPRSGPGYLDEDPERMAMLAATREQVRAANASLPARQREVLALREVESLSYVEIGEIIGLKENAVAQLISRARIRLRDEVRGSALASVGGSSKDCERALPLLAALQDGQDSALEDLAFLHSHLASCATCRVRRSAMEEAGVSYRALVPIVVLEWLRHATIARAADAVGADWSGVTGDGQGGSSPGRHGPGESGPDLNAPEAEVTVPPESATVGHSRRWLLLSGFAVFLVAALVLASTLGRDRSVPAAGAATARVAHPRLSVRRIVDRRKRHQKKRSSGGQAGGSPVSATAVGSVAGATQLPGLSGQSGGGSTNSPTSPTGGGHRLGGGTGGNGGETSTVGGGPARVAGPARPPAAPARRRARAEQARRRALRAGPVPARPPIQGRPADRRGSSPEPATLVPH